MGKFKVGDTVRVTDIYYQDYELVTEGEEVDPKKEEVGEIVKISTRVYPYVVNFGKGREAFLFAEEELELVTDE